ncbi:MAG TPA: transglutaminase domain-containing protein, partial [Chitinophagaceae bacterium]
MQPFRAPSLYFVAMLFISQMVFSQSRDSNVVIEQKIQTFNFSQNKGENPVTITEKYSEKYRCNEVRTKVSFSEMYNENETITDVDVKIDDKKAKWITPACDYYSIENIFYSDARICRMSVPLEKKGSHSEISLVKIYKDPRYFCNVYFTEGYFTENKTVSFIIPKWMKIEIKEYNFDGYTIKKTKTFDQKADADVITYELKNMPAYVSEAYAPGGSYSQPHLLVLCQQAQVNGGNTVFFNSLNDLYKWYYHLILNIGDDKSALQQKANELTAGITDDVQKIKRVFNWVQHNIRYIAFEDGIAGFKPAKANDVLNKKYGDCKGMANLTRGLLQALGYDARLCWIGTNHIAYDYSTPSMAVDNHMICALLFRGKKYFLDATETNIGFGEYAERIQGRQVLIEDGDKYILERVPHVTPEQNIQLEKIALTFDGTENLQGAVNISYKGEARSDLLTKIQATKKDNLQNSLSNYLAEQNNNYEINDLNTGALLGTDSVLSI